MNVLKTIARWVHRTLNNRAITRVSTELAATRERLAIMERDPWYQDEDPGELISARRQESSLTEELHYLLDVDTELRST